MHWVRLLNAILEVGGAVLTVFLMKSINARGDRQLRSLMVYVPLLLWIISASLAISTGVLARQNSPITVSTAATTAIAGASVIVSIILIYKYRSIPRHLAAARAHFQEQESREARLKELASRLPAAR